MGAFIARQPNVLICRFSTVVDCVTHYNMTEEDYIKMRMERAVEDARDTIDNYMRDFSMVDEYFMPTNMAKKKFTKIMEEMKKPPHLCKFTTT